MISVVLTEPRKGRIQVLARRGEDLVLVETVSAGNSKQVSKVAKTLGMETTALQAKLLLGPGEFEIAEKEPAGPQPFYVRGIKERAENARAYPDWAAALAAAGPEEVIFWPDKTQTCCLDIDYHGTVAPDAAWLLAQAERLRPAPVSFWLSKGGGLHAMYVATGGLTADELAAVALLSFKNLDHLATGELLSITRTPPGSVLSGRADTDLSAVATFLGSEVSKERVSEYLEASGMEIGSKYPHNLCPLRPSHHSHEKPVFVSDHGLHCKSCAASGYTMGSRTAGFFPWTAIIGGGPSNVIRAMANRFCHWEHAKVVLEDKLNLSGETARLAWKAMLHLIHGDDPRVPRAMIAGRNLIRLDRHWMTADALDPYNKDITALIGGLPVCQMKDGTVITEQVQRLLQSIDLDEEGYPTITPIRGIRMWRGGSEDRVCTVVPNRSLRSPALANRRPKYRKPDERIEDAWGILEEVFPGIDRNYLTLLIAAKGVSESQIGLAPNIIVTGPSSAGKTSTAHIAAAILGDKATDVVWQLDTQKFRQAYAAGTEVGSFVTVNEILKDADRAGSTALQAMDAFLNLTPDSLTHKLYTGAVPLGRNPATIVTDVVIPQTLRNDAQVARRFIYVPLTRKINWINSLVASGVHKIERLRLADDRYAEAANAILSEVMDRWFQEPKTLADIAVDLGYSTLDKSETGFDDPTTTLKQFYAAWKAQSPSTDTRWAGGWRTLRRDDGTPLAELWSVLSDGGKNWDRSRRLSEQDWQQLLDSEVPIRVEFHRHGQVLGVRFV